MILVTLPTLMANNRTLRACPGGRFAVRTLYIVIACVLSAFNIEPALDGDGNPQPPKAEFNIRILRYVFLGTSVRVLTIVRRYISDPKPFKCAIKPRSEGSVKLVKEAYDIASY